MTDVAYFLFVQMSPSPDDKVLSFAFKLTDAERIAEAREILADVNDRRHQVQGKVIGRPAPYNPNWSYHLDPDTIGFFESSIELCDANPAFVEKHLDELGGSLLPGRHWCPWNSALLAEVTHLIDPDKETWLIAGRPPT